MGRLRPKVVPFSGMYYSSCSICRGREIWGLVISIYYILYGIINELKNT